MAKISEISEPTADVVNKVNSWVNEYYPDAFHPDCSDYIGYIALMFGISVYDALGYSNVLKPAITQGLKSDQLEDIAIYYGLKKADQYRREYFNIENY